MQKNIISKENIIKYTWGNECFGWRLVDTDELSIIEEEMPANTEEKFHYHVKANQFFYIHEGTATFIVEDEVEIVAANKGFLISAGKKHKIQNNTGQSLKFLVISQPTTKNDRNETNL